MRTEKEIRSKIKSLQREMNIQFQRKRIAENESSEMRRIDNEIDIIGAKIRILQWLFEEVTTN